MKIAIDATPIISGKRAVKRNSHNLIRSLVGLDSHHDYTVFYLDWHNHRSRCSTFPSGKSAQECRVPFPGRLLVPSWKHFNLPKAEWLIGQHDILYATDLYFPPPTHALVLGTVRGIAYHVIPDKAEAKEIAHLKDALQYTLRNADYLLAVSRTTQDELIERLGISEQRIFVIQHGIDSCFVQLTDRESLGSRLAHRFSLTEPYIFFVGIIAHHKNILGLLKAYATIVRHGYVLPLVLAGPPGSAWNDAHTFVVKEGIQHMVHFLGSIEQDTCELTDLYNGASLFVFPSFYEGWSSPPLEAMACGTPVITSNCSSLPETVGDAALQVNPRDSEELAWQMENVLRDESLKEEMVRKGLHHAQGHTWENAAIKLMGVFESIKEKGPWRERTKSSSPAFVSGKC